MYARSFRPRTLLLLNSPQRRSLSTSIPDAVVSDVVEQPRIAGKAMPSSERMDVEAYAGLYCGRTKIVRLLFIAEKCGDQEMQLEALRIAYDEIKRGENTQFLFDVVQKIDGRLGPQYDMDQAWVDAIDQKAKERKEIMEMQLNSYKTNMLNQSIRIGYNDFGDFYYDHGQLEKAFKSYVRAKEYCTTDWHVVHMCLNAILVSIELGHFVHVANYVIKAEQNLGPDDPVTGVKLRCAAGLTLLEAKEYKHAAHEFLEIGRELGNTYNEVIVPQDVATYGGLCALACFERAELKSKVIYNSGFRKFLELAPQVRELIYDFYSSYFASCLQYLENLKANLLLDIHLHDHVDALYAQIRQKAIIQYTIPFISVDLNIMAIEFKTNVCELEKELETLMAENQIQARIDSHNKILYAWHAFQRNTAFQRVLRTGSELDQYVRAMLLRANLAKLKRNARTKWVYT